MDRRGATDFPIARYVTVEPRQTGVDPNLRAAIGAVEGSGILTDYDTGSTLLPHKADDAAGRRQVPITTLDALAQKFGAPHLAKLDVEGFELEALRGATTLFGETDVFIVEVALYRFAVERPMLHEVVAFRAARQYFVYDIAGFIRRPYDGAVGLMDLCFGRHRIRGSETEWSSEHDVVIAAGVTRGPAMGVSDLFSTTRPATVWVGAAAAAEFTSAQRDAHCTNEYRHAMPFRGSLRSDTAAVFTEASATASTVPSRLAVKNRCCNRWRCLTPSFASRPRRRSRPHVGNEARSPQA